MENALAAADSSKTVSANSYIAVRDSQSDTDVKQPLAKRVQANLSTMQVNLQRASANTIVESTRAEYSR